MSPRTRAASTSETRAKPARARRAAPSAEPPTPAAPIRRFDVFAEYQRQKALSEGMPADEAKGYGLWLAKVVAARRFGRKTPAAEGEKKDSAADEPRRSKWRTLGGKPQTASLFEREIVRRMGAGFYTRVFAPAIRAALEQGEAYTAIRDTLRRDWK